MTPAFSSWQAFFAMGGYAFYVWIAVAFTLIALCGLTLHTLIVRSRLLADIRRRQFRERRVRSVKKYRRVDGKTTGERG